MHMSLLCPVDFSESSRGALHYALAIARRFDARLTVLTVDDPLLVEVGDMRLGQGWTRANSERQLRDWVGATGAGFAPVGVNFEIASGKPAPEILKAARAAGSQLIVMSTHGRGGMRKLFFGATAERVLRETTIPVLLSPADPGALSFDDLARLADPMLVPVDFSTASIQQVKVAGWIASALNLRMMIGHVIEPIDLPVPEQIDETEISSERHRRACRGLQSISIGVSMPQAPEILIGAGEPAAEIAAWVRARQARLLVMALHGDASGAPRMGSITYRAIALSRVLTLALPPTLAS